MKALVIVAGGLHLGYVGCCGNEWVETPTLDRLAAEGVVFDQHYADRPDAAGAHRAWRTGRYHFPLPDGDDGPATAETPDLLHLLRGQGITTCLILDCNGAVPAAVTAGWERVEQVPTEAEEGTALERTLDAVCAALDRLASLERWLLWVELSTLLLPWTVPQDYRLRYFQPAQADEEELTPLVDPHPGLLDPHDDKAFLRLQRSYAGAVTYLDAGLGLLREELHSRSILDDLLLLVTTDRGLALGEHGSVGDCRPWLHDELIHLPLLVRLPCAAEAGRRVPALTQPIDLLPTLLDAFQLPSPPVHGHSLMPLIRGETEQVRRYACSGLRIGEAVEWALRSPEWSFLLPVRPAPDDASRSAQLYGKPDDRWEVNNVLQHHLELAEHLEQTLRGFVEASRRPGPLHPPPLRDVAAELAPVPNDPRSSPEGDQA
jgi:arylsulfatase A-like enzyme